MLLPTVYEDAGLSGGTLERPGLQRLLADIDAGLVDQIVVYKVDRLTRSLSDFAKLVERLEAAGAVFVSVTQSFNTATSMGRLTLHMLLSFAQFEREVTAERIRDKVAASKRKGLWMGGRVPLGYEKDERTLRINEAEAETVRTLYALYRKHGTLRQVKAEADRLRLRTKQRFAADGTRTGGLPFRRGTPPLPADQSSLRRPHPAPEACLRGPASIDHCSGALGRGPGAAAGRGCQTKETHDEGPRSPLPAGRQALRRDRGPADAEPHQKEKRATALQMRPPWASTSPLQMARPRPDPSIPRPRASPSMRENFLNRCGRRSAGTPWPSSETETATCMPSRTAATRMGDDAGEYLDALEKRLFNTWTRRCRSARTRGRSGGRSIWTVCRPLLLRKVFRACSTRSATSVGSGVTDSVPASMCPASSRSLIRPRI